MSVEPQGSSGGQPPFAPSVPAFASPSAPSLAQLQGSGDECPGCRGPVQPGQSLCATCGTVLHHTPSEIRCRQCGQMASSAYRICPHCGRELIPGLSPWLTRVLPGALLLLIGAVFIWQVVAGPPGWLGDRFGSTAQSSSPEQAIANPILTPIRAGGGDGSGAPLDAPVPTHTPVAEALAVATETPSPPPAPQATDTPDATATPEPSATATETPTETPTETATQTATQLAALTPTMTATGELTGTVTLSATGTVTATQTASQAAVIQTRLHQTTTTPTGTASATGTATATANPTVAPTAAGQNQQRYTIVSGDTFVGIALRFNISTDALLAANEMTIDQAKELQPGQELIIPGRSQALPPTATSTPGLRSYIVQPGDTIVEIAARNGIPTSLLLAANNMTEAQAPSLRPGDTLLIPPPGYVPPTPTSTPTARPTLIPTAVVPTATPTRRTTFRLEAPTLIDPAPGINVPCSGAQIMRWNPVNGITPNDQYRIFLGYVNSEPDSQGNVQVVPLFEQHTRRTNWEMNTSYCNFAPQAYGRRWRWHVQVFNGDTPVSPPSESREFTWR